MLENIQNEKRGQRKKNTSWPRHGSNLDVPEVLNVHVNESKKTLLFLETFFFFKQ